MGVAWEYFDRFERVRDTYLPTWGEGETKATQIVTAVNKLIYKWYNDGDVFDNRFGMEGWCNDLSNYANWLDKYTEAGHILEAIYGCYSDRDYEKLLKYLANLLLDAEYLEEQDEVEKVDTIYRCDGRFKFIKYKDNDEEDEDYDEYYD